jgi:hypothetical protein
MAGQGRRPGRGSRIRSAHPADSAVSSTGSPKDVAAYLTRRHQRLKQGAGYSFAVADRHTDEAVGNIGLWAANIAGYQREGLLRSTRSPR